MENSIEANRLEFPRFTKVKQKVLPKLFTYFVDNSHLNIYGANELTILLAEEVKQLINGMWDDSDLLSERSNLTN